MKKQMLALALTLPAFALLGGCGSKTDTNTTVADNGTAVTEIATDTGNGMDNATVAAPAMTGQQFADAAAASDAFEIAAGKLAQAKATSQDLKDFGAMMVKDHTASTEALKTAAGKVEPAITPNATITSEQDANLAALKAASGADFDALYKSQQVAAHQKALGALQGYAATGAEAALKDWASSTAPTVQKHLDRIQSL